MIKTCVVCGKEFEALMADGRSAHHVVTCSEECRRERRLAGKRADYIKKRGDMPDRECRICGVHFTPRNNAVTCSEVHASENRRLHAREKFECTYVPAEQRVCVICGGRFNPHGRQKACSEKCSRTLGRRAEASRRLGKRAANPIVCLCVKCGISFEAKRRDAKYCSPKCEYAANANLKRSRCSDWRRRNPEKQRASTKNWQENNRDRHLARNRHRVNKWRADHPGAKAKESREFRARHPEKSHEYTSMRTAAYRIARMIEKYGVDALRDDFIAPPPDNSILKAREATRRWRSRNAEKRAEYEHKYRTDKRDDDLNAQKRHNARETAALKLVRELQSKGIEALL